jgi:carboxymethylenebutenolidase
VCHDLDSSPPIRTISGAAVSHDDLVLEAADGNRFAAFAAMPDEPGAAGVVILPDVRGLYRFYEELALRFAEHGQAAVAIDYFGRTAGAEKRESDWEFMPHVEQTTHAGLQADVAAAVAHLRDAGREATFTVGFCYGGRNSWLAATAGHGLAGAIGFYGRPKDGRPSDSPSPIAVADRIDAPILALMGGDDAGIPVADVEDFDEALDAAGVEHEVVLYPGAPHSFFDRKQEEFADASADAWNRTLALIARNS